MGEDTEVRPVTAAQVKSGIDAKPGHKLVLVVDGIQGTARSADGDEEDEPPRKPGEPVLKAARFVGEAVAHGEEAELEVEVENGEGRRVKFVVEREENGEWQHVTTAEGTVTKGVARARVPVAHPSAEHPFADEEHPIRFRCELL